jgi:hypothetical protein
MTSFRTDLVYVLSALAIMFLAVAAYKYRDISRFDLWPDFARWALEHVVTGAFVFAVAYALAWYRREDKKGSAQ